MRTSMKSIPAMKISLLIRALCAGLLVAAFSLVTIPTGAGSAQKAEKAFADWKAAQEAVEAAKAKLADAQKALQNAMAAVAKSGAKPTDAQETALAQGRAAVAAAEAALREAERLELAARVALENEIANLPDGPLKDQLKRERNFPSLVVANGLHTINFDTPSGRVLVRLPDDIRQGDTISGTIVIYPKGATAEEKAKNQNALNATVFDLGGTKITADRPVFMWTPVIPQPDTPVRYQLRIVEVLGRPTSEGMTQPIVVIPHGPTRMQPGAAITPNPTTTPNFNIPPLGQSGRPIVITGPFDGNSSNTTVNVRRPRTNGPDFEKGTEDTSSGFGLLAESPRKAVFQSPNVTGPIQITVKDGDKQATGNYRNVGVSLSAPKTSLLKGESTTLTVEVNGLQGITKPVPLQLDAGGVITMDAGNFQNLRITPAEVNQSGAYTTSRAITGQQAGAFTVVATVIVSRFDVCISDDSNRHSGILWNTFTGDYLFTNPGSSPKPVGQPPSGGTITPDGNPPAPPDGTSLSGTGKLARKACVIVLTHNAPDRRVFSRLDTCTKTGDATVQTTSPNANVTITDKNVTDNSCGSK